jgi:hypothetical protein
VARAKRTDRAEARRRYRAQLAEQARDEIDDSTDEAEPPIGTGKPLQPARQPATPGSAPVQPSGIGYAFRAAFHQPNYREDIAYLPRLILHPSVWGPILVTIVTAGVFLATGGREIFSTLAIQYFVAPPPIGAIFIAGFFAPRASYLAGGLVGLVSALVLAGMIAVAPPSLVTPQGNPTASPSPEASAGAATSAAPSSSAAASPSSPAASPSPLSAAPSSASSAPSPAASGSAGPSPAPSQAPGTVIPARMTADQALVSALATSPLSGVFFGAAAAWYRRFLRLANPNRGRPPARQNQRRRR